MSFQKKIVTAYIQNGQCPFCHRNYAPVHAIEDFQSQIVLGKRSNFELLVECIWCQRKFSEIYQLKEIKEHEDNQG